MSNLVGTVQNDGYSAFNTIYGFSLIELEERIRGYVLELHPTCPVIDWDMLLVKGCG